MLEDDILLEDEELDDDAWLDVIAIDDAELSTADTAELATDAAELATDATELEDSIELAADVAGVTGDGGVEEPPPPPQPTNKVTVAIGNIVESIFFILFSGLQLSYLQLWNL